MSRADPAWLAALQARFGETIRRPLDRRDGVLRVDLAPQAALATGVRDARGLAVYNRQYWLRLFEALQGAFPLTCRLLGAWQFNQHAEAFLLAQPPRGWDLEQAADGFDGFVAEHLAASEPNHLALVEASRIDAAWRAVIGAPEVAPFRPGPGDLERLAEARLVRAPSVAWIEERWPLLELRRTVLDAAPERPLELPPALPGPRHWALVRRENGVVQLPLEPREAELLTLFDQLPVGAALGRLEAACNEEERSELPARAQAWLRRGMQLGYWSGLG